MKRTIFYTLLCAILLGITACSQKDDVEANPDGKVDLAKGLKIKLNFIDYNEDIKVDGTRAVANDTLRREWVDLGNGMSAEVTVKRDTTKSKAKASTRVISDGTYTLLAYDHTTHNLVGEITGQVVSGTFTPSAGFDVEPNKTYDFVCYNSKVTRNGNILTVTKANAEHARIGRTTQFIPNSLSRQWISFNMKPAASRLYIRLESWVDFPALTATLATNTGQTVPSAAQYDMSTDTWTTGTGVANSENLTFSAGIAPYYGSDAVSNSPYIYYLPSTDIGKLKLTLHGSGKLYNLPVEGANLLLNSLKDGAGLVTTMQPAHSYAVSVKLVYNYLYLMSDGSTGLFKTTTFGGGSKTPIGIVVSRSLHLAAALSPAAGGNRLYWYNGSDYSNYPYNKTFFSNLDMHKDMDGYNWTWNPSYSKDGITIKAQSNDFPAFQAAGSYQPTLPTGVTLTNGMENKKWFLPSSGQWKLFFANLGFGDMSLLTSGYMPSTPCHNSLIQRAIQAVGGNYPYYLRYLTSTTGGIDIGSVFIVDSYTGWNDNPNMGTPNSVYPFIIYQ